MASRSIQGRQMGFVEDLFEKGESVEDLKKKYRVGPTEFQYWLKDKRFIKEIRRRIWWAYQQSEIMVSRYTVVAAAKLVELTGSENPETARKACLDIISLLRLQQRQKVIRHISERVEKGKEKAEPIEVNIPDDKLAKLLEVLAQ